LQAIKDCARFTEKDAAEALEYNALAQSWPEITRLSREGEPAPSRQEEMFEN